MCIAMSSSARIVRSRQGAYHRAPYQVGPALIRVGRRSPALDALLAAAQVREATLLTAWNPGSKRWPETKNRLRAMRLMERLRRAATLPAVNGEGMWREESVAMLGNPRPAMRLGRLFGQDAVILLRRGGAARLRYLVRR